MKELTGLFKTLLLFFFVFSFPFFTFFYFFFFFLNSERLFNEFWKYLKVFRNFLKIFKLFKVLKSVKNRCISYSDGECLKKKWIRFQIHVGTTFMKAKSGELLIGGALPRLQYKLPKSNHSSRSSTLQASKILCKPIKHQ